ncbi:hypothetical protein DsansV1_C07g0070951 [Dioscorea sansibarensis]
MFPVSHNSSHAHVPELTAAQYNKLMDLLNDSSKLSLQHQNVEIGSSKGNANMVSSFVTMASPFFEEATSTW